MSGPNTGWAVTVVQTVSVWPDRSTAQAVAEDLSGPGLLYRVEPWSPEPEPYRLGEPLRSYKAEWAATKARREAS
ncbi:MAG: hypothetical protein L0I76_16240 [Pseudonocardia sp.]|nr:hypothetical protein [Pseudonocardia sp.]